MQVPPNKKQKKNATQVSERKEINLRDIPDDVLNGTFQCLEKKEILGLKPVCVRFNEIIKSHCIPKLSFFF